jgi:hypothetical protein
MNRRAASYRVEWMASDGAPLVSHELSLHDAQAMAATLRWAGCRGVVVELTDIDVSDGWPGSLTTVPPVVIAMNYELAA